MKMRTELNSFSKLSSGVLLKVLLAVSTFRRHKT